MKLHRYRLPLLTRGLLGLLLFMTGSLPALMGQTIQPHPDNPHYYLFRGKPTLLITSAEHYGAVINQTFDYVRYLDALKAAGLNYTRIYTGAMFEPIGKWIAGNPLGPKSAGLIVPWARSDQSGYVIGGNKFDLDHWNEAFFARLKDFVANAGERGIVVEICFFNSQYSDSWPISPLYYENNIQGVGKCDWRDAQALGCGQLTEREEDYVRKITREVNSFDNVILEICDECASTGTGVNRAAPWVDRMMQAAYAVDRSLPVKHMIAQEVEGPLGSPMDFSSDPRADIVTTQYLWGRDPTETGGELGGLRGLDFKYSLNKPIELNETAYYPTWYEGDTLADARVEAWEFMVGGGAGFNNLNGLFTVDNPGGVSPENDQVLRSLHNLRRFLESFDFLAMHPDIHFVVAGLSAANTHYRAISEPGRQYALYVHHATQSENAYKVVPGNYQENLVVSLPPGAYNLEWVDPASSRVVDSSSFQHDGGTRTLPSPAYSVDIALRVERRELDTRKPGHGF
jgi:hypothetical protein